MPLSALGDNDLLAIVEPMMDNLMDASAKADYARHVRDFSARARSSIGEPQFLAICAQYQADRGMFAGRELLGILRRPRSVVVTWRQWFTKAEGEYLAELFLAEEDGRPVIERVMVL